MKKIITLTLFVLISTHSLITNAQGQLTSGIQTSNLDSSISHWVNSSSDINSDFYAITYWVGGTDCGNYLKVYDATTFAPTSGQVLISSYHDFTRVRIDEDNNIYVLYYDRLSPGGTNYRTYLKKYNSSGVQIGSRVEIANKTYATDLEVAKNGDVLIGCVVGTSARIKVYRNMLYKGFLPLESINPSQPFTIQMDMKGDKFVVGYSKGYSPQLKIKRYNYVPFFTFASNINLSTYHSGHSETGSFFMRTTNQIALRSNWDVFFVVNEGSGFKTKKISTTSGSIFDFGNAKVDVDMSNRLIISKNYGSPSSENNKVKLYSSTDALVHEFELDTKIKNDIESLAIYNCEFLVTGIDRKFGGNPLSYTYESFHQLFNCKDCRPNMGATAVAKFRYPNAVNQVPSKYGPLDVTELCLVDNLLVDGSLSSCETGYFVGLAEFNPMTWSNTLVLHSGWVYPLTQAPNNINIVDFLPPGYHLRPGKIYKFRLAVGSPWHAVDIFFEVSCCKRSIIVLDGDYQDIELNFPIQNPNPTPDTQDPLTHEKGIKAFPNPVVDELTLDFSDLNPKSDIAISITTQNGTQVFSKTISETSLSVNTSRWPTSMYICTAQIGSQTFTKKIIKQ